MTPRSYKRILSAIIGAGLLFLYPNASYGSLLSQNQKGITTQSLHQCSTGYYKNSSGSCVHRPAKAPHWPVGSTAQCGDGTYSYSQHRSGTCSHHGGVAAWG